jgi:hypothetical protein
MQTNYCIYIRSSTGTHTVAKLPRNSATINQTRAKQRCNRRCNHSPAHNTYPNKHQPLATTSCISIYSNSNNQRQHCYTNICMQLPPPPAAGTSLSVRLAVHPCVSKSTRDVSCCWGFRVHRSTAQLNPTGHPCKYNTCSPGMPHTPQVGNQIASTHMYNNNNYIVI